MACGRAFDRLGERMREASVAEIAHMQAVAGQEQTQRLRALGAPALHQCVAAQHRHMVRGADIIDHLDEPLVADGVGALQGELRADEHHRNARGMRRGNAGLYGGAKQRLIDADDRVVGADLPDHQPRPAGLQRALQPLQRLGGEFAADASVLDVEVGARPLFELRLEPGRIGVRGRTRPDALGRRRADRQNVVRQADPDFREGERRAVRLEGRGLARARTLFGVRGAQGEEDADSARQTRKRAGRDGSERRRWRELFCTRSNRRQRTGLMMDATVYASPTNAFNPRRRMR